jgi:hypothetical protein
VTEPKDKTYLCKCGAKLIGWQRDPFRGEHCPWCNHFVTEDDLQEANE